MRTIAVLFKLVRPSNIIGLFWFFLARSFYKFFGIKFFNGISLTFREILVYWRPDFPSGIRFIEELISDDVYGNFRTTSHAGKTVMLDVGANIGLFSLDRCLKNKDLRVYCFEPHPETFSLLRINVELNKLSERIHIYNYAASDHAGAVSIIANTQSNMAKTVESNAPSDAIKISCWTLDAFCSRNNIKPTFLKIDVEGHEVAVLTGAQAILDNVYEVVVECHSETLADACKQLLTQHGFAISYVSGLLFGCRKL